ncbi:alpha/beta fold hydrolase [Roseiflexus sp.]|uniref:alpha/beta fold hydrolase n=1 Tax=Roseiflexus sp. TaxID=2562120 RepID=UPI0021DDA652|nr:alpha/beta hydrolase [Roseiflexus sp.]GIW00460.1 MAG: hydrolase [Roseiflexus sp.]
MNPWHTGDVRVNGLTIHYTRTGGAKPPLVLMHGFSDDGLCWTPVAQALEAWFDVIMIDARGHGRSDAPENGYGPLEHASDLAGVITALGLTHLPILGHSMGAITALTLAGARPDLAGALLLEDPPPWWESDTLSAAAADDRWAGMRAWVLQLKRQTRDELIAAQRAATPAWSDDELGPWADAKHRLSLNVINRSAPIEVDWQTMLRHITCPTLLITGDPARGALVKPDHVRSLQHLVPHLQVAHIPDAGHSIRRDQFKRYLEVVQDFLASMGMQG